MRMLSQHTLLGLFIISLACQENPIISTPVSTPPAISPKETSPQKDHQINFATPKKSESLKEMPTKVTQLGNVSQLSLDNLFNKSKKIIIRKSEVNGKILYESNKKPDLALLHDVMRISPPTREVVPCRHVGAPVIEFYYKKRYVGWVALHDNVTIRTSFWNTDGEILDKERFLKWFDRRGIAGPRRRAEAEGWRSPKTKKK